MQPRLEMQKVAPEAYRAMTVPCNYVRIRDWNRNWWNR